ncbi:MAG: M20/M25/M40 family metallo-hydrolase [Clostridia bacterium]|nr:M20/M25/M40 family metallo-hydrolase [Clostridia bacterium]
MDPRHLETVRALRARLHACPELSGREHVTTDVIYDFLSYYTTLRLERMDGWLLATHREGEGLAEIGLRADMDAIPVEGMPGTARHGCGHDGHSAILCGLALAIEGQRLGRNVHLIFQGGEETGIGARRICASWPALGGLHRIYGLHNIPGFPVGTLLVRSGCFACASEGLIVRIHGRPAHAADPAAGANPAALLSRLVLALPALIDGVLDGGDRLLMHTVIGLHAGGENFGLSAADGQLCLTLRGHRQSDIDALEAAIRRFTQAGCAEEDMRCDFETRDVFPDTSNPAAIVDEAVGRWAASGMHPVILDTPMRWSEDFGWYLKQVPGMFFGIGSGEHCPGLHTDDYLFPDAVIAPAVDAFAALLRG